MSEQWALVRKFEVAGPTQAQLYGIVLRTIRDTDQSLISDSRYFWGRLGVARGADHLITVLEQQLRQIRAVLA